ncbi:uncharacterized protein LOC131927752 [Physella acuta]|uniref:uncharacterized protein LOC131927752 n=1 Tax=Physella acuta TaxID=109671 RepID=UPI0027DE9229|nr:uncharacterized protein LOC131927752 [Physella acuta]XP_059139530.1 uncharacterized protein LOC131927752 [Physella acuta]
MRRMSLRKNRHVFASVMATFSFKTCRNPAAVCVCFVDLVWLFVNHLFNTKLRRVLLLAGLFSVVTWWSVSRGGIRETGEYSRWHPKDLPRPKTNAQVFLPLRDQDTFMYSAIANTHQPENGAINIVITTLDAGRAFLDCCVLLDNNTLFVTSAEEYFFYHTIDVTFVAKISEYFSPGVYLARQYVCSVPDIGQSPGHVTLKPQGGVCSSDIKDYLPVVYPAVVPGGLAICAKIAHSGGLDPEKVIEWFEVQRLLGVDKVLMFNMKNPENLTRVFQYYQELGVLDLQPYELPGNPANRTLMERDKRTTQFHHDESLAVLECRQRMAGYSYVMSHDVDEFIIPRRDISLKEFFKEKMKVYQDSAGFYFEAEFFIYNWGPTNPEEDMMVTRFRKATKPHWECTKYVYLPSRVLSSTTHSIFYHSPYTTYKIDASEAVLHHYRRCPDDVWPTCFPETIKDNIMTKFKDLYPRVLKVREATNTKPQWNVNR